MSGDKFRHYYPGVQYNWPSESDYETLTVEGMEKPDQAEFDALAWPPVPTLNEAKAARLAELANIRWQREVGGITFVYEGNPVPIPTDRESRAEAFIAAQLASAAPGYTRKIKVANGLFIEADAATIIGVAGLIDQHVQACFNNEADITALILAAASVEAVQAIDLTVGWPG